MIILIVCVVLLAFFIMKQKSDIRRLEAKLNNFTIEETIHNYETKIENPYDDSALINKIIELNKTIENLKLYVDDLDEDLSDLESDYYNLDEPIEIPEGWHV